MKYLDNPYLLLSFYCRNTQLQAKEGTKQHCTKRTRGRTMEVKESSKYFNFEIRLILWNIMCTGGLRLQLSNGTRVVGFAGINAKAGGVKEMTNTAV